MLCAGLVGAESPHAVCWVGGCREPSCCVLGWWVLRALMLCAGLVGAESPHAVCWVGGC